MNDWLIEVPEDLVPFERLTEKQRIFFVERIGEQFTTAAAHHLYDLGFVEEKSSASLPVPLTEQTQAQMKVELVASALGDWQVFSRTMEPALEAAVVVLRSDSSSGSCVIPLLRAGGFLLRHGHLRIVYRRAAPERRLVIYAIGCWAINPLAKVWRYFDQQKAEGLLTSGKLYLRRLDLLTHEFEGDPYEGSPTYDMFRAWKNACIEARLFRSDVELRKRYVHERRATFVSCWQKSEHESWLMWKQYCPNGGGFALETTERKMHHQLMKMREARPQLFLRSVHYIDHWRDDPLPHEVPVQVFLKPAWFSHERETRFAWFRGEYARAGTEEQIEAALATLGDGETIPFNVAEVADSLVCNPFSTDSQRTALRAILREQHPILENRFRDSAIRKKPVTTA